MYIRPLRWIPFLLLTLAWPAHATPPEDSEPYLCRCYFLAANSAEQRQAWAAIIARIASTAKFDAQLRQLLMQQAQDPYCHFDAGGSLGQSIHSQLKNCEWGLNAYLYALRKNTCPPPESDLNELLAGAYNVLAYFDDPERFLSGYPPGSVPGLPPGLLQACRAELLELGRVTMMIGHLRRDAGSILQGLEWVQQVNSSPPFTLDSAQPDRDQALKTMLEIIENVSRPRNVYSATSLPSSKPNFPMASLYFYIIGTLVLIAGLVWIRKMNIMKVPKKI